MANITTTEFSPAIALWNHRQTLANCRDRLQALSEAVGWQNDLQLYGWGQWFVAALEFQPDLIVELGRGRGNSTCVFTEAANQLGNCQVVSLCLSEDWHQEVSPKVASLVAPEWFEHLDAQVGNMLKVDFKALFENKQRVLLLWDAHGFEIASFVLGYVLPLLQTRQHLVIMHDISDARYVDASHMGYKNSGLWHGRCSSPERMVLGHLNSAVPQAVSILDFTSRNGLTLHSSDHSFHTELSDEQFTELKQLFGAEWFQLNGHWFWFSLNEKTSDQQIYFPTFSLEKVQLGMSIESLERKANLLEQDKAALEYKIIHLTNLIDQFQSRIAAMESSKFWQLRGKWIALKKKFGLKGE